MTNMKTSDVDLVCDRICVEIWRWTERKFDLADSSRKKRKRKLLLFSSLPSSYALFCPPPPPPTGFRSWEEKEKNRRESRLSWLNSRSNENRLNLKPLKIAFWNLRHHVAFEEYLKMHPKIFKIGSEIPEIWFFSFTRGILWDESITTSEKSVRVFKLLKIAFKKLRH